MMYPHTITVINRHREGREVKYYFTTVENVFYQDKQAVITGSEIHASNNQGYVQIPYVKGNEIIKNEYKSDKEYIKPSEWKKLMDKSKHWTLQEDDFILKGTTQETVVENITDKRTIESVEDIDYSIIFNSHYGVTLK